MKTVYSYKCSKEILISVLDENKLEIKSFEKRPKIYIRKNDSEYMIESRGNRGVRQYEIEVRDRELKLNRSFFFWWIIIMFWVLSVGFISFVWITALTHGIQNRILFLGPLFCLLLPIISTYYEIKLEKEIEDKMTEIITFVEKKDVPLGTE